MHFLRIDGPIFRFLETITNLLLLNLLFLICSIPVVTIGPALTATYYVALKIVRKEEAGIVKSFFHSFRENFKQSLFLGLGILVLAALLIADLNVLTYVSTINEGLAKALLTITILLLLVLVMTSVYVFAVLAQFDNTTKELLKWSAILVLRHFPVTLISVILVAVPVLCLLFLPGFFLQTILPIMLLMGFSGIAYLQSSLYVRVFAYYMPEEEQPEDASEEEIL